MNIFHRKNHSSKKNKVNVTIIVMAALTLVLISAVQYYYTHRLLEQELEKRAETELSLKAIITKSRLRMTEKTATDYLWNMKNAMSQSDKEVYEVLVSMAEVSHNILGCGVAFMPEHEPYQGQLFEPYAKKVDGKIVTMQLSGEDHDYTKMDFYSKPLEVDSGYWADPYDMGPAQDERVVTTYSCPVRDKDDKVVAVFGLDMSLKWLGDTLNYRHIYPSSFNMMLTEGGDIIAGPSGIEGKTCGMQYIAQLINDSTVNRDSSRSGHSKVIRFYDKVKGDRGSIFYAFMRGKPHWQMVVVCYDSEVYENLYWMRINMLILMAAAFGVLGFIIHRYLREERRLRRVSVEQERLGSELRIASGIQMAMLPEKGGNTVAHPDVKVYGTLIPAKEVGGDLYEFFIRDEKLYFCIGDVSGKGVPSALVMAVTQAIFRSACARESNPVHIMGNVNEVVCRNNTANMFVTLFIGVLDLPTGLLRYCNAGHDAPLLIRAGNDAPVEFLDVKANLPVGLFGDFNYQKQTLQLEANDTIFLYTDGLNEARNANGEMFGIQRMTDALATLCETEPEEMVHAMTAQVEQFATGTEQSDDLTILVVNYSPRPTRQVLDEEVTLTNHVAQVDVLNAFVEEVTNKLKLDVSKRRNVMLAVEEAVVNVINYAYPPGKEGKISVKASADEQYIKFVVTDEGKPFDPTISNKADTTLSVEERPVGGLGILLVRQLMDSINYERRNGKNILTLKMKI